MRTGGAIPAARSPSQRRSRPCRLLHLSVRVDQRRLWGPRVEADHADAPDPPAMHHRAGAQSVPLRHAPPSRRSDGGGFPQPRTRGPRIGRGSHRSAAPGAAGGSRASHGPLRLDRPHNRALVSTRTERTKPTWTRSCAARDSAPPGSLRLLLMHHHLLPLPDDHVMERGDHAAGLAPTQPSWPAAGDGCAAARPLRPGAARPPPPAGGDRGRHARVFNGDAAPGCRLGIFAAAGGELVHGPRVARREATFVRRGTRSSLDLEARRGHRKVA